MAEETGERFSNWSGSVEFRPGRVHEPASEGELGELVAAASRNGETLRPVGSGHSSSGLFETDAGLVSLDELSGVVDHDPGAKTARVRAGTTLNDLGTALQERNLALPNLGDVSLQTVAGAIGTGTHGSGPRFGSLSDRVRGGRLVTGDGDVRDFDAESDPDLLRAAQVSLGALGIFTELELDLVPAYKVQRREYCTTFAACEDRIPSLIEENRHFDFYWYPRSDEVKLRLVNAPGGGTPPDDLADADLVKDVTGWWYQTIPQHDRLSRRYEEMEYAVPADAGLACFRDVRDRVRDRWRQSVGWRVLWRTVDESEAYLSTEYDRETVTISLLQNAQLDYWDYFEDVEEIFLRYGGRPHWGKKHTLLGDELAERYPAFDRFRDWRRELDPGGVFLNDYLRDLLGIEAESAGGSSGGATA